MIGENDIVVFWRDARGILVSNAPGRLVQGSVSKHGLSALAKKYRVFILHFDEEAEDIVVERLPHVETEEDGQV